MRKSPFALLAVLVVVCLAGSAWMWRRAFPLAGVEFRVSREEARARLEGFIESLGHPLAGYRHAITFSEDGDTKRFLEIEHGLPQLEARTRQGLNVWYWTARWFRPSQHEEFSAQLDPQGWLVGFSHTIEEERELPSLELPAARALAEEFLRRHAAHLPFERLVFLEESHEQRPKRVDWDLTWERTDLRLGTARYRIEVNVLGDTIGGYSESLDVPESWTRRFAEKREVNALCDSLAGYATMPMAVGAFVLLIVYLRKRQLDHRALPWGWLVLVAAVQIGSELNDLPELLFGYATTTEWNAFISKAVLAALKAVLFAPLAFWLLVMLADALYREQLPEHPRLRRALGASALRDPHTVRALGVGVVLAAVAMAYVPGFYIVAERLGAWCPVEIKYTEVLSGWVPWVGPMDVGLSAAFGEELFFRVIGVLLYVKLLRRRWVAVLLACVTWAFLHSNYDQMPGYLRGIELSVEGVLWGWVVLRFGVIATLTAHYLFDCWLGSLVVFQSPSWTDKAGALVVSLWPVALFACGCILRGRHAIEEHGDAHGEPAAEPEAPPAAATRRWDFTPMRFTARRWWLVCVASIAAMTTLHFTRVPQDRTLALGGLDLSRARIAEKADAILRERGFAPESWRRVITIGTESTQARYLLGFGTLDRLAGLFGTEWPDVHWNVRYFQIGEREEVRLQLDKHGTLVRWNHSISREAPGASLDRDAALALARATMQRERGFDPARETLVSESVTEQEHRRDHYFEFKRDGWKWRESELRTSVRVQGDEVVGFSRWVKLPDAVEREHAKSGWRQLIAAELREWMSLGLAVVFGVIFVVLIRKHVVPWRLGFVVAIFPLALNLIDAANDAPWFFSGYSTTTPLAHFLIRKIGGGAMGLVGGYLGQVLRISVALGLVAWAFGWTPRAFADAIAADARPRRVWRDALPLVLVTLAVLWAMHGIQLGISGRWLPWRAVGYSTASVGHAVPWLRGLVGALENGLSHTLNIAVSASLIALGLRRAPRLTIAAIVLYPIVGALDADTPGAFAYDVFTGELSFAVQAALVLCVWRFNPLVIFLSYAASALIGSIALFLGKGGAGYRWDGVVLAVLAATYAAVSALKDCSTPAPTGDTRADLPRHAD